MKLIVGLGNPGPEYVLTPHNLGFLAVDYLAESWGTKVARREGRALTGRAVFGGEEILLAKPQTFMNLSGLAVQQLLKKYSLEPEDLTVLTDDLDLPLGMIRVRRRGTAGGHNGLKSLIGEIQTDRFARVRMESGSGAGSGGLHRIPAGPIRECGTGRDRPYAGPGSRCGGIDPPRRVREGDESLQPPGSGVPRGRKRRLTDGERI